MYLFIVLVSYFSSRLVLGTEEVGVACLARTITSSVIGRRETVGRESYV